MDKWFPQDNEDVDLIARPVTLNTLTLPNYVIISQQRGLGAFVNFSTLEEVQKPLKIRRRIHCA